MTEQPEQRNEERRLEASALVASRVSREESHQVLRKAQAITYLREMLIVLIVLALALLGYRNYTESGRVKEAVLQQARQSCHLYRDVAINPVAKTTTITGLRLLSDFRNAYYAVECNKTRLRELPPPDPRLLPYLDADAK